MSISKPLPLSGTQDLYVTSGGLYFTDIYYGDSPELLSLYVLYGTSDIYTAVEFQSGASFSGGSIIIGSSSPSGVLQTFDLENRTVLAVYDSPTYLLEDNVEDFE